jgi:predicted thioesterase
MRVHAHAEVIKVEGRKLTFRIWAEDAIERIGEGIHERIIVNVERFDVRTQAKAAAAELKE